MRPISWKGTVGNRSQLELQGEQPLILALVRHTYLGHEHGLIIPISRRLSRRQGPVGASNTNPRGFYTHVSIHCQNACRLRCSTEAREKKYTSFTSITINTNPATKEHKQKESRIWSDSAGLHLQEATLVGYRDGTVHLSSSDGTALEIPEIKLSSDDLAYIQTQDVYKKAKRKVTSYSLLISWRLISYRVVFPSQFRCGISIYVRLS